MDIEGVQNKTACRTSLRADEHHADAIAPHAPEEAEAGSPWDRLARACALGLVLENRGSVARDHLASERTFLAYVRTSLGIAFMGVGLVQLLSLSCVEQACAGESAVRLLGAAAIVVGVVVQVIGFVRYFRVQEALLDGRFHPARNIILFITSSLGFLIVMALHVVPGVNR